MSVNSPPQLLVYGIVSDGKEYARPGLKCVSPGSSARMLSGRWLCLQQGRVTKQEVALKV